VSKLKQIYLSRRESLNQNETILQSSRRGSIHSRIHLVRNLHLRGDSMIIATFDTLEVGKQSYIDRDPFQNKDIEMQPVLVLRRATRNEFIEYWSNSSRRTEFLEKNKRNPVPDTMNFYEITTD
jgi:hypothetical protein